VSYIYARGCSVGGFPVASKEHRPKTKIIDADGHIVEPAALWKEYTEPAYRDRIPQIAKDADGIDRVKYEGRMPGNSIYTIAAMCIPGGLSQPERARRLSWDDLRPGSNYPHVRINDMDAEGIDISFLYPSMGVMFGGVKDVPLAVAPVGPTTTGWRISAIPIPTAFTASLRFRCRISTPRSPKCAAWSRSMA
jgi:hypothetical protein